MTPLIFLVLVSLMIAIGVAINIYLYNHGMLGRERFQSLRRLNVE